MVSPSPSPSPRAGPPPPLLIPADADELDKEYDSFPDISTRSSSVSFAAKHQHKASLHLAPFSGPVTYQLSAVPLSTAPVQNERQTFLANAALRSTFIRQGTLQRLGTLRSSARSSVLSGPYRPPPPIVVRQESRSRLGTLTRQPTVRFAAATLSTNDVPATSPQRSDAKQTNCRLPSYVPIIQVADSMVYRGELEEDERCQYGYEVMPVLSTLLEHQSQHSTPYPLPHQRLTRRLLFSSALVLCRCDIDSKRCECHGWSCVFAHRGESATTAAAGRRQQASALLYQSAIRGELTYYISEVYRIDQ